MDRLVKFMSHVDMVKISVVETTDLVEEARKTHEMNPTPTAAMGRTLTMGALMADRTMLYNPSAVSVWVKVGEKIFECKGGETTRLD